ncbi:MAG: gliding motility protein GldN [Bacteroidota bacterium]
MLREWTICLCLLSSTIFLLAQTESITIPTIANERSWLDGGAAPTFMSSPPLPYAPVREADILWEKRVWRVINTREKINRHFDHFGTSLFDVIAEGIATEQIQAYSPEDDQFSHRISYEEIWDNLISVDSIWDVDPVIDFGYILQVVTNSFNPERIRRWCVQEVWYQDARYSHMQVRIIGIAPLLAPLDMETGSIVGDETPIFWINYSEARNWLAQHPVASFNNEHRRTSWEDLFAMRRFDSYVYQQSDMQGRRLEDYLPGTDKLLEGEKNDRAIQNREMDMWSY